MTYHPIHHADGSIDHRYSIAKEFCGHPEPRFVVRFCGDFICQSKFYTAAVMRAVGHNCQRKGAVVIVEQPASP